MRRSSSALAALLALLACAPLAARADGDVTTLPQLSFGVQGLLLAGDHRDIAGDQHGLGAGPLGEIHAGSRHIALHLEGLPMASEPQKPSQFYGQATPALGLLNADLETTFGKRASVTLGLGTTIINQRTPLPKIYQVVGSRLAGVRYVARYRAATHGAHFVEGMFGVAPSLWGTDHFDYSDGHPQVNKDEVASELDAYAAIGYRVRNTEWLFGLRALNFSAKFTRDNSAGDRNVGIGAMIEWRRVLRP